MKLYLGKKDGTHVLGYNEFTQLMKGLQGERLRQAFRFFDTNQDGFIKPDQFKRIILVRIGYSFYIPNNVNLRYLGTSRTQTLECRNRKVADTLHTLTWTAHFVR